MAQTIKKLKCLRCGYEWYPRNEQAPRFCANCNSPSWNKPRKNKQKDEDKKAALAGELQSTINSLAYDEYFNFTSKRLLLAYVTYDDDLTKNPLTDLERAKLAIDALAKESRERIEYGKQCAVERERLASEILQLSKDTEQAAYIQGIRTRLDLYMQLPAILPVIQNLRLLQLVVAIECLIKESK